MARRQLMFFRIGCYLAFLTAALHLTAHLAGPQPSSETERQLLEQMKNHQLGLPGAPTNTVLDLMTGYSLVYSLTFALCGGLGLIVARRGTEDQTLMLAVSRALTGGFVVITVISGTYFFIVPTLFAAACAISFAMASLRPSAS